MNSATKQVIKMDVSVPTKVAIFERKKTLLKLKSQVKDQLHSNRFADILTI